MPHSTQKITRRPRTIALRYWVGSWQRGQRGMQTLEWIGGTLLCVATFVGYPWIRQAMRLNK